MSGDSFDRREDMQSNSRSTTDEESPARRRLACRAQEEKILFSIFLRFVNKAPRRRSCLLRPLLTCPDIHGADWWDIDWGESP